MADEYPEKNQIRLLANQRNRAILSMLNEAARPLDVRELADKLVAQDVTMMNTSDYEDEREEILISLHHNHLPKLANEGLIEYDHETNVVTYRDYTAVEWDDLEMLDELLSRFTNTGPDAENAIGILEGKEDTIERGRQLFDEAEEEVFCIYVSEDMLREECCRRMQDALDRGVDTYLGSQNPSVHEFVRRELPEVMLWEPQQDWLSNPSAYPRVGRLVLADRQKVMLAVLNEAEAEGESTETAVTAEGEDNPLVVLVRELLGARLDHLDYQSEQFLDELPFEP